MELKWSVQKLQAVRRESGFGGVLQFIWKRLSRVFYLHEEHIWYEMPLNDLRKVELPENYELVRATENELDLAAQTDKNPAEARQFIAAGYELWLVRNAADGVFSSWVFQGKAPAVAAQGGWLTLPEGIDCLDDSMTSPAYRSKNIATAAILGIAESVRQRGIRTLVTKIAVGNSPSHRLAEKSGFLEVALIELTRIGPRYRVRVHNPQGPTGKMLETALTR